MDPVALGFRPLDMVIEVPTLWPDGTILDKPGYDAAPDYITLLLLT